MVGTAYASRRAKWNRPPNQYSRTINTRSPWEDGPPPRRPRGLISQPKWPSKKNSKTPAVLHFTPWAAGEPHWGFSFIPCFFFLPRGFTVHIHQHCSFSHLWASHAGEGHFAGLHNDIQAGQPHETRNLVLRSMQRWIVVIMKPAGSW